MSKNEVVQLYVQLDVESAQINADMLVETLEVLNANLEIIAQWDVSNVVTSLATLSESVGLLSIQIATLAEDDSLLSTFSEITSILTSIQDFYDVIVSTGIITSIVQAFSELYLFATGTSLVLSPIAAAINAIFTLLAGSVNHIFTLLTAVFGGSTIVAILAVIATIALFVENFDIVQAELNSLWCDHIQPFWNDVCSAVSSIGNSLMILWNNLLQPIAQWMLQVFEPTFLTVLYGITGALTVILEFVGDIISGIIRFFDGLIQFIVGVFTLDWEQAWNGIIKIFSGIFECIHSIVSGVINTIIWMLNMLIGVIYSTIAGVVNGLSGIVETAGKIVGRKWSFSVPTNPPKIPYLAQGAVLPANRPFLAMVGDQRYGTNIEAPLSTIQEAVALVMADMNASNLAGQRAIVGVLREILSAVLGIEIDGETLSRAVDHYNRKIAVVRGGL